MAKHRFDPWSFVPGLLLAAFALVVLGGGDVSSWNFSWVGPAVLIAAGIALLFASRGRREPRAEIATPTTEPEPEDDEAPR